MLDREQRLAAGREIHLILHYELCEVPFYWVESDSTPLYVAQSRLQPCCSVKGLKSAYLLTSQMLHLKKVAQHQQ